MRIIIRTLGCVASVSRREASSLDKPVFLWLLTVCNYILVCFFETVEKTGAALFMLKLCLFIYSTNLPTASYVLRLVVESDNSSAW